MNLKDELQSLHDDASMLTEVDENAMVASVKEHMPELTNNTKSIAADFGDTLMKTLKNPNGQTVKIKNTHRNEQTGHDAPPMFIVGKQFGVANVARSRYRYGIYQSPPSIRYMSTYFSNSNLISHLQQEHVDGIKRASQQEVAQAYLDFSKQFETVINKINEEVYHTSVNIPIVMNQKTNVRFQKVVENSGYGHATSNEYTFFNDDDKKNVVVTDIITTVGKDFQRWDPAKLPITYNSSNTDTVIMYLFGYVGGGKEKKDLGHIKIQNDSITYNATYLRLISSNVDKYNKLVLKHNLPKNPDNIGMTILTKCAITNDDMVKGLMEKINTFYRMSRKTMKYIQLKFADRILFNGAF